MKHIRHQKQKHRMGIKTTFALMAIESFNKPKNRYVNL